jgi:hypothetical protein
MKTVAKWILMALVVGFVGCTGSSQYMQPATAIQGPSPDKALIYFMRPSGFGFAINFQIWDGDRFIGLSQAKSYFGYECQPGKHLFVGFAENKQGLEVDLEAGKTYYALTQVRVGGWRARMAFVPVTRSSEHWNTVESYRAKLTYVESKDDMLRQWESQKKAKTLEVLAFLNSAEGQKYIMRLNRSDGR